MFIAGILVDNKLMLLVALIWLLDLCRLLVYSCWNYVKFLTALQHSLNCIFFINNIFYNGDKHACMLSLNCVEVSGDQPQSLRVREERVLTNEDEDDLEWGKERTEGEMETRIWERQTVDNLCNKDTLQVFFFCCSNFRIKRTKFFSFSIQSREQSLSFFRLLNSETYLLSIAWTYFWTIKRTEFVILSPAEKQWMLPAYRAKAAAWWWIFTDFCYIGPR